MYTVYNNSDAISACFKTKLKTYFSKKIVRTLKFPIHVVMLEVLKCSKSTPLLQSGQFVSTPSDYTEMYVVINYINRVMVFIRPYVLFNYFHTISRHYNNI